MNLIRTISVFVIVAFLNNTIGPNFGFTQELILPQPGKMIYLSPNYNPPTLKGIKVHPENPLNFEFILDRGDSTLSRDELKEESSKLVKYFLASLTTPEQDMWVNLSPYEKTRIVPESFGQTEMGRDLLAQDYILKQITASIIYPEDQLGKKFWKRVYEEAMKEYGTTNVPVNTFNKVWIVPQKAVVFENAKVGAAYIIKSNLKVMMEQDYLSLQKHTSVNNDSNSIGAKIVREIVIPELTKEVNEGRNFAQLRQVYQSMILAAWYKKKVKDSILNQVYMNENKIAGVNINNPQEKQKIYERYLEAFKLGAFNYIKEENDPMTQQLIPKKYFSGGLAMTGFTQQAMTVIQNDSSNSAMISKLIAGLASAAAILLAVTIAPNSTLANDQTAPLQMDLRQHSSQPSTMTSLNNPFTFQTTYSTQNIGNFTITTFYDPTLNLTLTGKVPSSTGGWPTYFTSQNGTLYAVTNLSSYAFAYGEPTTVTAIQLEKHPLKNGDLILNLVDTGASFTDPNGTTQRIYGTKTLVGGQIEEGGGQVYGGRYISGNTDYTGNLDNGSGILTGVDANGNSTTYHASTLPNGDVLLRPLASPYINSYSSTPIIVSTTIKTTTNNGLTTWSFASQGQTFTGTTGDREYVPLVIFNQKGEAYFLTGPNPGLSIGSQGIYVNPDQAYTFTLTPLGINDPKGTFSFKSSAQFLPVAGQQNQYSIFDSNGNLGFVGHLNPTSTAFPGTTISSSDILNTVVRQENTGELFKVSGSAPTENGNQLSITLTPLIPNQTHGRIPMSSNVPGTFTATITNITYTNPNTDNQTISYTLNSEKTGQLSGLGGNGTQQSTLPQTVTAKDGQIYEVVSINTSNKIATLEPITKAYPNTLSITTVPDFDVNAGVKSWDFTDKNLNVYLSGISSSTGTPAYLTGPGGITYAVNSFTPAGTTNSGFAIDTLTLTKIKYGSDYPTSNFSFTAQPQADPTQHNPNQQLLVDPNNPNSVLAFYASGLPKLGEIVTGQHGKKFTITGDITEPGFVPGAAPEEPQVITLTPDNKSGFGRFNNNTSHKIDLGPFDYGRAHKNPDQIDMHIGFDWDGVHREHKVPDTFFRNPNEKGHASNPVVVTTKLPAAGKKGKHSSAFATDAEIAGGALVGTVAGVWTFESLLHPHWQGLSFSASGGANTDNQAMLPYGGIDLNSNKMNLELQNETGEIRFHIDPAMIQQFEHTTGFSPLIVEMKTNANVKAFLGLA